MIENYYLMIKTLEYFSAIGIQKKTSEIITKEVKAWFVEMLKRTEIYLKFCECYNIFLDNENSIELNKGILDSIISTDGKHYVKPISVFATSEYAGKRLSKFNEELIVNRGELYIRRGSILKRSQVADLYHTHNPYNDNFFKPLDELCDLEIQICYGMFGSIVDKDKEYKLKRLRKFVMSKSSDLSFEYDILGDGYYALAYNKSQIKTKKLVKGR